MSKIIYVEGLGCDRRLLEKSKIIDYLKKNDYRITHRPSKASYILLFTCAFKKAEEDYSLVRLRALQNYKGRLLVFGCLPDIAPHRLADLSTIHKLAPKDLDHIDEFFDGIQIKYVDIKNSNAISENSNVARIQKIRRNLSMRYHLLRRLLHYRDRRLMPKACYYLMVCRGCLGQCSYCAIPRAIGSVKSKPIPATLAEFREGLIAGRQNFVLLGDDLGSYGLDGVGTLPALMEALWREISTLHNSSFGPKGEPHLVQFHLKELHPKNLLLYEESLSSLVNPTHVKSLLCPIQSGSPRVLALMRREHTVQDVRRIIRKIREINPDIELSTQIIAGFPTETDEDFQATLELVVELRFRWVVVFPYDPKKGTVAAGLEGRLSNSQIERRVKKAFEYFRHHSIKALTNCPW
jgi:MiaB/RimO family radical SAM methylthiotransferase